MELAAKAEEAMWNWYLEWAEIARVAVRDRRLLRELGFLNTKRTLVEEIADVSDEDDQVSEDKRAASTVTA